MGPCSEESVLCSCPIHTSTRSLCGKIDVNLAAIDDETIHPWIYDTEFIIKSAVNCGLGKCRIFDKCVLGAEDDDPKCQTGQTQRSDYEANK